jgi:hypothetical protein
LRLTRIKLAKSDLSGRCVDVIWGLLFVGQTRAFCRALENDAKREDKGMMSKGSRKTGLARRAPDKRYRKRELRMGAQTFMDRLSSSSGSNSELYLPNRGSGDEMRQLEETCKNGLEYRASSHFVKLLRLKKPFSGFWSQL